MDTNWRNQGALVTLVEENRAMVTEQMGVDRRDACGQDAESQNQENGYQG